GGKRPNGGLRAAGRFSLFDYKVTVGKGGDLGQMGDTKHLIVFSKRLELFSYCFRHPPADSGIDLVEDQRTLPQGCPTLARSIWSLPLFDRGLQGQNNP